MTSVEGLKFAQIKDVNGDPTYGPSQNGKASTRLFFDTDGNSCNRKPCLLRTQSLETILAVPSQTDPSGVGKTVSFQSNFDKLDDVVSERDSHVSNGSGITNVTEAYLLDDVDAAVEFKKPSLLGKDSRNGKSPQNESTSIALEKINDGDWLLWAGAQFAGIAKGQNGIDKKCFKQALHVKESFFADRFFDIFDKDKSGAIELGELMAGLHTLTKGTTTEKLKFLFDVYDQDGSGYIDIEELRTVLQSCIKESSITLGEEELDMLTETLFNNATATHNKDISFEEFEEEIRKHPIVLENLTMGAAQWLRQPTTQKTCSERHRYLTGRYALNNLRKIIFILLCFAVNIICFIVGCWNYRESNGFIISARGAGLALNFDCMFILVVMLRKGITWLRTTPIHSFLPLDQHIMIHKFLGVLILVLTVWHTGSHIGNAVIVAANSNITVMEFFFTTKANIGWVAGFAPLSGVILDVILLVICVCSMPFVRRAGHFQIFYWTHVLYVPFWIILILHCPNFWYWFVVPGVIFLLEKIFRSKFIKTMRYGETYISEVNLMPSGVTHLVITRPANMKYKPGDYIFLQIPALAFHEWHPFTISSAPELEDVFWVHVRSAGHWTNKLYKYFDKYQLPRKESLQFDNNGMAIDMTAANRRLQPDFSLSYRKMSISTFKSRKSTYKIKEDKSKKVHVKVYVDGPYGTASRELFETEHAVLIGSGIGVTPYASVLQSIMYRFLESKKICPSCAYSWCSDLPPSIMKLKKVDFIWINRDQKCFEWFVSLLTQLEIEQRQTGVLENILDMHLYMTSALNGTDMKGIGLQMALDLLYQEKQIDLITGLRTRTKPGRPNWNEIFTKISKEKKGKVKVFFCGSPVLAKTIKAYCGDYGFSFCKEHF